MSHGVDIVPSMKTEVLTMLLAVALAALVAACGAGFRWLRSDFRDLRGHVDSRFEEQMKTTNARFTEVNGRLDRLENRFDRLLQRLDRRDERFDDLVVALARGGFPIEPRPPAPASPLPAPEPTGAVEPSEPMSAHTEAPTEESLPSEQSVETADPPRARRTDGTPPATQQSSRSPPAEPFGPTAAPA